MTPVVQPQRVCVLGATGSIGANALDIIARHPERFNISALSAHNNVEGMRALCVKFKPPVVVMSDEQAASALSAVLPASLPTQVVAGETALSTIASADETDTVIAGIVGAAGLPACLAAVKAGKRVLIANKEALVVAGEIIMQAARENGATVLPIDSEHNALFQCLPQTPRGQTDLVGVDRLTLTASGGPFRTRDPATLAAVSVAEAVAHPNWSMGRKISVDSATMMNKGLEVIEAARFFYMPPEQIDVLIHPQSIVHALVQYRDGSVLAQMGNPDMRTPIANALSWPERIESGVEPLDLASLSALEFSHPDPKRFPCLALAMHALAAGSAATAVLNAANEVAVAAFLEKALRFDQIPVIIESTLAAVSASRADSLETLLAIDQNARRHASAAVARWRQ